MSDTITHIEVRGRHRLHRGWAMDYEADEFAVYARRGPYFDELAVLPSEQLAMIAADDHSKRLGVPWRDCIERHGVNRLPYDYCRCAGKDCDRKTECLRHTAMEDMGPRTPWTDRYCDEIGRESQGFIAVREDAK